MVSVNFSFDRNQLENTNTDFYVLTIPTFGTMSTDIIYENINLNVRVKFIKLGFTCIYFNVDMNYYYDKI